MIEFTIVALKATYFGLVFTFVSFVAFELGILILWLRSL